MPKKATNTSNTSDKAKEEKELKEEQLNQTAEGKAVQNSQPVEDPVPQGHINKDTEIVSLREEIASLKKMIEQVSDKNRLDKYNEQFNDNSKKIVGISLYDNRIVVAWSKMITNNVKLQQKDQHVYDQTTELTFLDGKTMVVNYEIWQRDRQIVRALVEETKEKNGLITYVVSTKDHGEFEIAQTFIN